MKVLIRLVRYSAKRFRDIGIDVSGMTPTVEKIEHGVISYHVSFSNGKGAVYIVNQIWIGNDRHPFLDYGIELRQEGLN